MHIIKNTVDFPTLIRRISLLSILEKDAQVDLERRFVYKRYPGGTKISSVKAGDQYLIRSGRVYQFLTDDQGEDLLLNVLTTGEMFGTPFKRNSSSIDICYVAQEDTSLLILHKNSFKQHLKKFPQSALVFIKKADRHLQETYEAMACLSMGDAPARLKKLLVRLGEKEGRIKNNEIILSSSHTQSEFARMIGTRRETVSRILSQLEKEGFIVRRGRKIILHSHNQKKLA
ncbi:MAG: Crp/Fnr family transcriptional regulator [Deltaproteobacteria bacterium]|jgi:CRP/FNR family cyclic AMP-dependent transcriptional regulator|nr:Crp/Fnr family transcriptional regulator [Deltaproteobacteria bacterium]